MSSYSVFAEYYDILTQNVPYAERGEYFHSLIKKHGVDGDILLDLACGTGTLSFEMAKHGYNVIGIDSSVEMLSVAMDKKYDLMNDEGSTADSEDDTVAKLLFLCQPMEELNLYGSFDICICALDSINHITSPQKLQAAFERVSLFMNPNGLFIFDVNTLYKHEALLSGQAFVYDCEGIYCVWQNSSCKKGRIGVTLDMFCQEEDGSYSRETEQFFEQAYSKEMIEDLLTRAGMRIVECFPDPFEGVQDIEVAPRMLYVVRNIKTKQSAAD